MSSSYVTFTAFGIYILDEDSKILFEELTYPNEDESANNVRSLNNGEATDQLRRVLQNLDTNSSVIVSNSELGTAISSVSDISIENRRNAVPIKWFLSMHDGHLVDRKTVESKKEISRFRRQIGLMLARSTVSEASQEKDLSLKHAIDGVEELDKSINVIAMRLREWYSLHFPVLNDIIEDHEQYASVIDICGVRKNITKDALSKTLVPDSLHDRILSSSDTLGAVMSDEDITIIKSLSRTVLNLYAQRRELEQYVSTVMTKIAPNIISLVGPMVGARLISLAGSLKELARKPSSTLQILGAEKALFRSLKTGADPPKHGVIYQAPEIHSAPYWQRGKIARALSGKLSLAARIDAYADTPTVTNLKEQFESRLAEIQRQNPDAPPPKPPKPPKRQERSKRKPSRGSQRRKRRGGSRR
jgi:nucleolar protein 56